MTRVKKNQNVKLEEGVTGTFGLNFNELLSMKECAKNFRKGQPVYWQTSDYNTRLYMMFRAEILSIALNRFKWVNLPKTCDERYLEMTLIFQGQASIAFPQKQKGVFYSTQLAQTGRPNIYDNPVKWRAIGNNGFRFNADWSTGVCVWDNRVRYPLLEKINIWARELCDVVRTEQMNRMHQRMPYVFKVPQEMEQQAVNVYKQVAGGEPAIIGYEGLETIMPEIWQTNVEYLGEELSGAYTQIWQRIYHGLGIPNPTFKSERMIEDEVKSQSEPSMFVRLDSLNCRNWAADYLNAHFIDYLGGKKIHVVWNYDHKSENYNSLHDLTWLRGDDNE